MQQSDISLDQLKFGDRLERSLVGLDALNHVALYIGKDAAGGHIVFDHSSESPCRALPFEEFAKGHKVRYRREAAIDQSAARMRLSHLLQNPRKYHLSQFNCEHAVQWILTGREESAQINTVIAIGLVSAAIYAAARG